MNNEATLIKILGEKLYEQLLSYFSELFNRKAEFKIIMARRFFVLYKIFLPIMDEKGLKNQYGRIISNHALHLYKDQIKDVLEKSAIDNHVAVVIADDMIVYGRTINSIFEDVLSCCDEQYRDQIIKNILVMAFAQNVSSPQIDDKYKERVYSYNYTTRLDWKQYSDVFSLLIRVCPVANTSYVQSLKLSYRNKRLIENYCKCQGTEITTDKLSNNDVVAYAINTRSQKNNSIARCVEMSGIRVYFYDAYDTIIISPLVVLKSLNEDEMKEITSEILHELNKEDSYGISRVFESADIALNSVKIRLLILLLSQNLMGSFLDSISGIEIGLNDFDYDEILRHSFDEIILENYIKCHQTILKNHFFECEIEKYSMNSEDSQIIEMFLLEKAMIDNMNALDNQRERKDAFLLSEIPGGFTADKTPEIFRLIDNSFAAIKSFYDRLAGLYVSKVYSGEQAYRVMYDKFKRFMPALYTLQNYSTVFDLDLYELLNQFIEYLFENNIISDLVFKQNFLNCIRILKENKQLISDVYVVEPNTTDEEVEVMLASFLVRDE